MSSGRKRMPPKCDIDSPRLISVVAKFPVLWDMSRTDYHDINARSEAWESVALYFHSASADECLNQWTHIRGAYANSKRRAAQRMRSGAEASAVRPYKYAARLSFLTGCADLKDEVQVSNVRNHESLKRTQAGDGVSSVSRRIKFDGSCIDTMPSPPVINISISSPHSNVSLSGITPMKSDMSETTTDAPNTPKLGVSQTKPTHSASKPHTSKRNISKWKKPVLRRKKLSPIPESEVEDDVTDIEDMNVDGCLPPLYEARKKRQDLLNKKREQQCQDIKEQVAATKKKASATSLIPSSSAVEKLANILTMEEDRYMHFALSLVDPLRQLPSHSSRDVIRRVTEIVTNAEDLAGDLRRSATSGIAPSATPPAAPNPPPAVRILSSDQQSALRVIIDKTEDGAVIAEDFGVTLRTRDLQTLEWDPQNCSTGSQQWIGDNVINFYFGLLQKRADQSQMKVHCGNTFLYTSLKARGVVAVIKWLPEDLLKYDLFVIPIHHEGNHWTLVTIHPKDEVIRYYDSKLGSNPACMHAFLQLFAQKYGKQEIQYWDRQHVKNIPYQSNSFDCGVFACSFAERLSVNAPIKFTENDMPQLRMKMLFEILQGSIMDESMPCVI